MNIETEKIFFNQIVTQKKELFSIEDSLIIPDVKPDILSVISTSANVYVYKKELVNGRVKIDGGMQVDIMYIADDEKNCTRALHTTLDFSKSFDLGSNIEKDCNLICKLKTRSIDPKILNGRKISLQADLEANISIYSNKEKEFICGISDMEQMQRISNTVKLDSLVGKGEAVCSAKDTIKFDENLSDVLNIVFYVRNIENKISYNKVLSKADCVIDALYLTEDEKIYSKSVSIPVMGFIDIQGISDNAICDVNYDLKNIDIKLNNAEDRSASVDVDFCVTCQAYEEREFEMIQDLYSPEESIELSEEQVNSIQDKRLINNSQVMSEKINLPEVKDRNVYSIRASVDNVSKNIVGSSIQFEGDLNLDVVYESRSSGRLEKATETLKFSHSIDVGNLSKQSQIDARIDVSADSFEVSTDAGVDVNVSFSYGIDVYNIVPINVISDVKVEKINEADRNSSLIIYFVKEGDTLWKIAKKFKSTIDEIVAANELENPDKLKIGEQLFIPRYTSKKVG